MKNPKVVIASLFALFFIYLTFTKDWLFIVPAVFIAFWNQKQLTKK